MVLSQDVLEYWAKPPSDSKAQNAYSQVKTALSKSSLLSQVAFDSYLQGSYRNSTHIRDDSDVDVVAELISSFSYDDQQLSAFEKSRFHAAFPTTATYRYQEFRRDVGIALASHFGTASVSEGSKTFKIAATSQRSAIDVLPCIEHRRYTSFPTPVADDSKYLPGIKFYTTEDGWIVNWPRIHYFMGVQKNDATDTRFKPMVRIGKNARGLLCESDVLAPESAPSYFIECLIYNVPNHLFAPQLSTCLSQAFQHLSTADLSTFTCVNGIDPLFGGSKGWTIENANAYIAPMLYLAS